MKRYRYGRRSHNDSKTNTTTENKTKRQNLRSLSQKFTSESKRSESNNVLKNQMLELPWFQKYEPQSLSEVAIHKRKLNDVKEHLDDMLSNSVDTRILLLTGPSGCSKSTIIKELSHLLIPKYRDDSRKLLTLKSDNMENVDYVEYISDQSINGLNQMGSFREFLNNCKYRVSGNLSLILVEDFPNVFHDETRTIFQKSLMEWLYCDDDRLPPLVLSLSECEIDNDNPNKNSFSVDNMYTAETIIGRKLLNDPRVKRIKFNPISMTLTKKALNNIVNSEKVLLQQNGKWKQRTSFINNISQNCGDIRSSICALEFWATSKGDLELATRKQPTSYFHAVGKIIYGSKDIIDDNEMINNLLSSTSGIVSNSNFKLGLLENYESFNQGQFDIESAYKITDALSQSDNNIKVTESLEYATRKVRSIFHDLKLKHSNGSSQQQHHHGRANFPIESKINRMKNSFDVQSDEYFYIQLYKYSTVPLNRDIILSYGYYGPLIRKQLLYKKKSLEHYVNTLPMESQLQIRQGKKDIFDVDDGIDIVERLGGPLNQSEADRSMISTNDSEKEENKSLEKLQQEKRRKIRRLMNADAQQSSIHFPKMQLDDEDKAMLEDIIVNSDNDDIDNDIDNDFDDSIYEMLSQRAPIKRSPSKHTSDIISESLSDSDLEML
ncbi:similar to Saccharomyces cerevisiae YER173W RAD24 Checkpoint protein, involved in the activation of the DNA damage and meiotic pachytene checkpoints [Maudiozyma saulgeensis]|uniref:Similar to Saccharomyces cerevisiae YER173W RAD24 Checkpoint protein, involved in the activation of the DNA damage and meiotic pachytene checkpoints n=1 Tax=Maudiozyma saulgeensis TaxID=1789683 RepID=A0A1X7R890_9SACH|nr:similar to Saccharomyces cerevisiae YER173W RAD24 Checkpoint protein, involved in the activation of the DNA damage and meiotic pachytene checkpoints [Kazachstania saulgeensis]